MPTQQPENDSHSLAMLALLASPFLLTEPGRQVARKAFSHVKDAFIPARTAIVNSTKAIAPAEEAVGGIAKMMEEVAPKAEPSSFFDIMNGEVYGGEAPAMPSAEIMQRFKPSPQSYQARLAKALAEELKANKVRLSSRMTQQENDAYSRAWNAAVNKVGPSGIDIRAEDKVFNEINKDVFDLTYDPQRTNNPMAELLGIKPVPPKAPKIEKRARHKPKANAAKGVPVDPEVIRMAKEIAETKKLHAQTMDDIMSSVVQNTYDTIHLDKSAPNTRIGVLNIALSTLEGDERFNKLPIGKRVEMMERVKRDIFATLPNVDK